MSARLSENCDELVFKNDDHQVNCLSQLKSIASGVLVVDEKC